MRYGALALISTAGLPGASLLTVFMVVVAALTSTITRAIGSYRFPDAGHITPGAVIIEPEGGLAAYQRIVQRVFGTFAGVLLATVIVGLFHSIWFLTVAVLSLAFMVPQGTSRNYWLHSALTALLIFVLYDFAVSGHGFDLYLLAERIQDVLAGCLLALVGTMLELGTAIKASGKKPV